MNCFGDGLLQACERQACTEYRCNARQAVIYARHTVEAAPILASAMGSFKMPVLPALQGRSR